MSVFGAGGKADSPRRDHPYPAGQQDMGPAVGAVTELPVQTQVWGLAPCAVNFGQCAP